MITDTPASGTGRTGVGRPVVGWVGLGDQGLPMATAIAQAGFPLHAWARRPTSLAGLSDVEHVRHDDLQSLAAASDVVGLCVGRTMTSWPWSPVGCWRVCVRARSW